jgi:hypothetical protein
LDQFLIGYLSYLWLIIINFFSINKASTYFLFEVSYNYQPAPLIDRLWLVIDSPDLVASHLFELASIWNVVRELLAVSKQCIAPRSSRLAQTFVLGYFVFLSSKVYIFT